MSNVVSPDKEDYTDRLYRENFIFLDKVVGYEINTLTVMESIYESNSIADDNRIKEIIKSQKINIGWMLSTIILGFLFVFSAFIFKNYFILIGSLIFFVLAYFAGKFYFGEDNNRNHVLLRALRIYQDEDYLSMPELGSLQKLISEDDMLELIRLHDTKIPMSKVYDLLYPHFMGFKDYKARKTNEYIKENNKTANYSSHHP